MKSQMKKMACAIALVFLLLGLTAATGARADWGAQDQPAEKGEKAKKDKGGQDKSDDKDKAPKAEDDPNAGQPILWQERPDMESLDLFYGAGGKEGAPDTNGKFTFVRRSPGGTSEKIVVDDDKGRSWTVKFGPEARPETAASRLVWAAGYHVDQVHFVKRTRIEGRGGFEIWDVRFERRDDGTKDLGPWSWTANKFTGTRERELQGLKVLMALINNWDIKDENNKIVRPNKESGGDRNQRIHYVSDLGGTLGSTGNAIRKIPFFGNAPAGSKGDPDAFARQPFIEGVQGGKVIFHYRGKSPKVLEDVTVENARWMGELLGRLSDKQLGDAFRAGGFTDSEINMYVRATRKRIDELKNLR